MGNKKETKLKNQVSIEKQRKQDLIWASGHYLGQHLPQDFDKWTDKKLNKYLEEWAWEPHQGSTAEWLWEQIDGLAYSMREYVK